MKGGSKTISERATRFLPVDMRDRLKSAFNRNSATAPADHGSAEPVLDYNAIFNANRPLLNDENPHLVAGGPPDQTHPSIATISAAVESSARPIAPDIEEAEIVSDLNGKATSNPEWDAVLLKTHPFEPTGSAARTAQLMAVYQPGTKPTSKPDSRPQPQLEAKADNSKNGEAVAQKSKSRFFGDFSATESVRLKVEKRNEKGPAGAIPAGENRPPPSPSGAAEVTVLGAERGAIPVFALDAEPMEQSTNGHHATTEALDAPPAASQQAHINLLEEYDSMDAKGQESGNGTLAGSDGNGGAAAIVIERDSKFSGQLKFSGAVTIDGQVEGALVADRIMVHEGGVVHASVEGHTVVIAGTVKGDVCAHGELEILPSGIVDGSVTAPTITVRRGGRVEGLCSIGVPSTN